MSATVAASSHGSPSSAPAAATSQTLLRMAAQRTTKTASEQESRAFFERCASAYLAIAAR